MNSTYLLSSRTGTAAAIESEKLPNRAWVHPGAGVDLLDPYTSQLSV